MKNNFYETQIDKVINYRQNKFIELDRTTEDLQIAYYNDDPIKNEYLLNEIVANRMQTIDYMTDENYHADMDVPKEDLRQELIYIMYKALKSFKLENKINFNSYLYTSLKNHCKNVNARSFAWKRTGLMTHNNKLKNNEIIHKNEKYINIESKISNDNDTKLTDIIADNYNTVDKQLSIINITNFINNVLKIKNKNVSDAIIKISQGETVHAIRREIDPKDRVAFNRLIWKLKRKRRTYSRLLIGLDSLDK